MVIFTIETRDLTIQNDEKELGISERADHAFFQGMIRGF